MSDDDPEKPTVAIRREILLGLVAESTPLKTHAHTVRRRDGLADGSRDDFELEEEGVSPTLVFGVIMLLVTVFFVAARLS